MRFKNVLGFNWLLAVSDSIASLVPNFGVLMGVRMI